MAGKPQSWKKVRDERRKENFVGRGEPIRIFTENLQSNSPDYMVISITGEGGVGKSTLLARFTSIATSPEFNATVVVCDDKQTSPVLAMGHIAKKLAEQGITHKEFDERYKKYGELRQELESDPKVPRGGINLLAMGITDLTIKSLRKTPGVGVFFEYADEKAAGEALSELMQYSISKWGNKDEVKLLREPEQILTPLFLDLIKKAYNDNKIIIMFDVFERTSDALAPWLLMLFNFEYDEFDTRVMFVVSGRESLEQHWTELAGLVCHSSLEPFVIDEIKIYLSNNEITDESLVNQIYEDTNGLPVLVELLTAAKPKPGSPLPDVSKDAVERFLQWTPQEERRQVALYAAIPRQFNKDIIHAILGEETTTLFNWLSTQSYIRTNSERGSFYHEKIRELMIRHLRNTEPNKLSSIHEKLSEHFQKQQLNLNLSIREAYENENWRRLEIERIYHVTANNPEAKLGEITDAFLNAIRWYWQFAEQIIQLCTQIGSEAQVEAIDLHGKELLKIYKAYLRGKHVELPEMFIALSLQKGLSLTAKGICYSRCGKSNRILGNYQESIKDYKRAIEITPDYDVYYGIAETYRLMGQFEDALQYFNKSLEINPKDETAYAHRAMTYRSIGKLEETINDFNVAIAINPKYAWAITQRGKTFRLTEKFNEALKDFNKSIQLQPESAWCFAERGLAYQIMGDYEKSLSDFNKSIEIDPKYKWAIAHLGYTYSLTDNYEEAIKNYDNAIALDAKYIWAINARAYAYKMLGEFQKSFDDYKLALSIDSNNPQSAFGRGNLFWETGFLENALSDYDQTIKADKEFHLAHECKSIALRSLNRFEEALDALPMEISGEPCDSCYAYRGEIYRRMGNFQDALTSLNLAANEREDFNNSYELSRRAAVYKSLGLLDEMKKDIERVLKLVDEDVSTCYNKAVVSVLINNNMNAINFLDKAISQEPSARIYAYYDDLFLPIKNTPEFKVLINFPRITDDQLSS